MELKHLRYFAVLAKILNFRQAAERLHITQPGLSQRIKGLERALGVTLFERTRNHVELSKAGAALLPEVERLLDQADRVISLAGHLSTDTTEVLRLNHTRSARTGLPNLLIDRFREKYDSVNLAVATGFTSFNVTCLRDREIDVAFVRPPVPTGEDLVCRTIATEPLTVALPADHRFADRDTLRPDELTDEPLVFFPEESGPGLWSAILGAVYGEHVTPRISRNEPDEEHMLHAVSSGAGITIVTESSADVLRVPGVLIKRFAPPEPTVPLGIAWRRHDGNATLHAFLALTYEFAETPVQLPGPRQPRPVRR
jgi:DNA-binding transcriptional LysR family regulator